MNRINLTITCLMAFGLAACAAAIEPSARVTSAQGPDIASAQAEAYDGPKARIATADFEDKMSSTGYYRAEYGRGMSDMLTTALFQTNRFIVLEREKLKAVLAEQNLGDRGRVRRETAAPIGELEGAELLVTAAITGFDPGTSGGTGSLGSLPYGAGSIIGALAGSFKTARAAMDLRIIDVRNGRVVAATSAEGTATGLSGSGAFSGGPLSGALSGFAGTPLEAAMREMIRKAVDFIVSKTPRTYYRYTAAGQPMGQPPTAATLMPTGEPAPGGAGSPPAGETMAARKVPEGAIRTPKARRVIQSIHGEAEKELFVHLNEVTVRGAVLTVVVSLSTEKQEGRNCYTASKDKTHIMDYSTGKSSPAMMVAPEGWTCVHPGEVKQIRYTFKALENAKTMAITLFSLGTFDDVKIE